jgi:hypothetical protein
MIDSYVELIETLQPRRIIELGIYLGGSTAMLAALADPVAMLALDLDPTRVPALDTFLAAQDLARRVRCEYGVDQSDRTRVSALADEVFGSEPVDFVLDDASHQLELTRTSFEILFPRVRPGGLYVIEDWAWGHGGHLDRPDANPLSILLYELAVTMPVEPGLLASVTASRHWISVRRGPAELDPGVFRLADYHRGRSPDLLQRMRSEA